MTSWIWWTLGTLGVGGTLLAIAIFTVGWPVLINTKWGRTLLIVGTAGLGVIALYFKGRNAGRLAERAKLKARIAEEVADSRKEKARIDAMTDEEVDRELAKWDR